MDTRTLSYLNSQHGVFEGPRLGPGHGRHAFSQPLHYRKGYLFRRHKGQPEKPVVPRGKHRQVERDLSDETLRPALFSQHCSGLTEERGQEEGGASIDQYVVGKRTCVWLTSRCGEGHNWFGRSSMA